MSVEFDKVVKLPAEEIQPQVTWGTNPQMVTTIDGKVPDPKDEKDPVQREWIERALKYMVDCGVLPILIRVDDPKAFDVGAKMGIKAYQGFLVDSMLKTQQASAPI